MSDGHIVETGTPRQILTQPVHVETSLLVSSYKIKEAKLGAITGTAQ